MAKTSNKQTSLSKKILIIIGVIIGTPIVFVLVSIALSPVFNSIDHAKFTNLDRQSQKIFSSIMNVSNGADNWSYQAKCEPERTGDWPTGKYLCATTASLDALITSINQLNILHKKYYSVINDSDSLKPTDSLDEELPSQFGAKLVVSSAERHYKSADGFICSYAVQVAQTSKNSIPSDTLYGSPINGGLARVLITFDCGGVARGDWYGH